MNYIKSPSSGKIQKVSLTATERAALSNTLYLPEELAELVENTEVIYHPPALIPSIEDGLIKIGNTKYAVSWLNSPNQIHRGNCPVRIIYRKPKQVAEIPFDFPRALIALKVS